MSMKDKPGRPPRIAGAVKTPGAKNPKTQKDAARARKTGTRDIGQVLLRSHLKPGGDGGPVAPGDTPGPRRGNDAALPVVGGPKVPVPTRQR